uniref:Uncharacterized protein n=1 Tax=Octactis speculum TaxID=3111310 RepID=A0A7S2DL78_9STRA
MALTCFFWTQRWLMLRAALAPPKMGDNLATSARSAIFLCIFVHVVISKFYFIGWPFDDAVFDHTTGAHHWVDKSVYRTPQGLIQVQPQTSWVDDDREGLVALYGLIALILITLVVTIYSVGAIFRETMAVLLGEARSTCGDGTDTKKRHADIHVEKYTPRMNNRLACILNPPHTPSRNHGDSATESSPVVAEKEGIDEIVDHVEVNLATYLTASIMHSMQDKLFSSWTKFPDEKTDEINGIPTEEEGAMPSVVSNKKIGRWVAGAVVACCLALLVQFSSGLSSYVPPAILELGPTTNSMASAARFLHASWRDLIGGRLFAWL